MTPAAYMNKARGQPSRLKMTCVDRSAPRRITTGYPRYKLNKYREHRGQSTRRFQSAAGRLRRLKAFEASTSSRQSVSGSSNTSRMACTAALTPAFIPHTTGLRHRAPAGRCPWLEPSLWPQDAACILRFQWGERRVSKCDASPCEQGQHVVPWHHLVGM